MSESVYVKAQRWLARDPDPRTRAQLQTLIDAANQDELAGRFSARLAFGTAGLRGLVGAGPGMMNQLVIRETSAGLGDYLLRSVPRASERGILVAYDARLDSQTFARDAACVFAASGITTYLTPQHAATPLAAFGVLALGTAAGVVITASHNPPEYNGYKVYWENGAQIIPPRDVELAAAIEWAGTRDIPWLDFEPAKAAGKIVLLGKEFYRNYVDAIGANPLFASHDNGSYGAASVSTYKSGTSKKDTDKNGKHTSIAYTAMHGVGAEIAETLLQEAGFRSVHSVASQAEPDGNFPTVKFPNPEEPGAMDEVLALARAQQTTLACANDPDADRLAVAVRFESGAASDYQLLSGDMLGVLLADYLLHNLVHTSLHEGSQGRPEPLPIVATTLVSSSMLASIAQAAGAVYYTTLTGFKWLAHVAIAYEEAHEEAHAEAHPGKQQQFLFAYEEALGYAVGPQVRDKDGLSALLAVAQMTEALARQGKTLLQQLESLYRRHGIHLTAQRSIDVPSHVRTDATTAAATIGDLLRQAPPTQIGESPVLRIDDLSRGNFQDWDDTLEPCDLPASDVLIYRLENKSRVIVRPSGTEPRVKCYYEVVLPVSEDEDFTAAMQRAQSTLTHLINAHQTELSRLVADSPSGSKPQSSQPSVGMTGVTRIQRNEGESP